MSKFSRKLNQNMLGNLVFGIGLFLIGIGVVCAFLIVRHFFG